MKLLCISLLMICLPIRQTSFKINTNLDLQEHYEKMLKSSSYLAFEKAGNEFIAKLNFQDDFDILDNETLFLKWLTTEINRTNFKDLNEANSAWLGVKEKYELSRKENDQFYIVLKMSTLYDLTDIIALEQKLTAKKPCEKRCETSYLSALKNSAVKYENVLKYHEDALHSIAWLSFENKTKIITRALKLCKLGCTAD